MKQSKVQAVVAAAFCIVLPFLGSCATVAYEPATLMPPPPVREFRGAWVATVANSVWPSRPTLSSAEQRIELLAILDRAVRLKLNAIILQVRPACDAMYASPIEPWSEYLTGTMGKAPDPLYDPLEFAIAEAHKRGLELHAWFNPYRARHFAATSPIATNHVSQTHPQLVRSYGKYLWLDPGEHDVVDYTLSVVLDVVRRYDVDGIHFDDYFYPYQERDEAGRKLAFPDDPSWKRFGADGKLSRDDWRRENVNAFVERAYNSIKQARPWVKFGISPFGIWRPRHPPQILGQDAYAEIYADARKWLANGWLDYCSPQLYWAIEPKEQSFPVLLKWWAEQNVKGRHLWPGMDGTKVGGKWNADEIANQIRLTRRLSGVSGQVHWNMKSLMNSTNGLGDELSREIYTEPALVPASPWLDNQPPARPNLAASVANGSTLKVRWQTGGLENVWLWVLQSKVGSEWRSEILPAGETSRVFRVTFPDALAVCAVDRAGNTSAPAVIALKRSNPGR